MIQKYANENVDDIFNLELMDVAIQSRKVLMYSKFNYTERRSAVKTDDNNKK